VPVGHLSTGEVNPEHKIPAKVVNNSTILSSLCYKTGTQASEKVQIIAHLKISPYLCIRKLKNKSHTLNTYNYDNEHYRKGLHQNRQKSNG